MIFPVYCMNLMEFVHVVFSLGNGVSFPYIPEAADRKTLLDVYTNSDDDRQSVRDVFLV